MTQSRYETLARTLRRQIDTQVWLPGERLPSLRDTCKQSGLSLMTVLQAYQLLESQGVIVARPQSGYFVAAGAATGASFSRRAFTCRRAGGRQ